MIGDGMVPEGKEMPMRDEKPMNSYMSRVMSGMKYMEDEDLEPMEADISVDAEDGEKVAFVITGMAKGGKIMSPMGAMVDIGGGSEKTNGLKQMLSDENTEEEE